MRPKVDGLCEPTEDTLISNVDEKPLPIIGDVMVEIIDIRLHSGQLYDTLLPSLVGCVFHVTRLNACEQILTAGEIRSNINEEFPITFGSTNSYFRKRDCVSFFDYRSASCKQIEDSIGMCSPYCLPSADPVLVHEPNIAFLFLSKTAHDRLIPWTKWQEEKAYSDKIVPWVEAGYPGAVPITLIEKILRVSIDYPADSIAAIIRRARYQRE